MIRTNCERPFAFVRRTPRTGKGDALMPTVQDILSSKGSSVHSTAPDATVLQAVQKMNQQKIGALLVMEDGDRALGMFTERDVLRRVVGELRDPGHVRVGDVMTKDV